MHTALFKAGRRGTKLGASYDRNVDDWQEGSEQGYRSSFPSAFPL